MGCATSVAPSSKLTINDNNCAAAFDQQRIVLSEQRKKLLVRNWNVLSTDLSGRGARIFLLIFDRNPLVQSIFSYGQMSRAELVHDVRFKGHALRFMQAVGAVVENIDDYDEVMPPVLNDLGRRHAGFKGFKPIYFNEFQDSILQVFAEDLGSQFTAFAHESWKMVLQFILTELKRGFTQCLRDRAGSLHRRSDGSATPPAAAVGSTGSSQVNLSLAVTVTTAPQPLENSSTDVEDDRKDDADVQTSAGNSE